MSWVSSDKDQVLLKVWVQPGATHNRVVGIHGDHLKIKISSPPVDGKANKQLRLFIAKVLHVPARSIELRSGTGGRRKVFSIEGLAIDHVRSKFSDLF